VKYTPVKFAVLLFSEKFNGVKIPSQYDLPDLPQRNKLRPGEIGSASHWAGRDAEDAEGGCYYLINNAVCQAKQSPRLL
jgi:hypothetical protein